MEGGRNCPLYDVNITTKVITVVWLSAFSNTQLNRLQLLRWDVDVNR